MKRSRKITKWGIGLSRSNHEGIDLDRIYTDEEFEFLKAVDCWKRENHNPYPSWTEVLQIAKSLGWRKDKD